MLTGNELVNRWQWWVQMIAACRWTDDPSQVAGSEGRQSLDTVLHASDEVDRLT